MSEERTVIREAASSDAAGIVAIYDYYVAQTVVTFEEEAVPAADMARRIEAVRAASLPWLVAKEADGVVGYAYAARWRERSAYRFSVEVSVYLHPDALGRGLGTSLYARLFALLEAGGVHAAIGGISLPNAASVALHEKFGMRQVAHFPEVGFKFERWVDVGYWQRTL